ncbi:kinase [Lithospermum erythrorhizon]|uniref:1-phosphatidylinositol-3-phosphate 5-kinase n=1 Tax=Lithospermum erythrorhizon TaxID=34254 RepID=A0AAV3P009_LITER
MGIPDSALPGLVEKVRSWIYWRTSDLDFLTSRPEMAGKDFKTCSECRVNSVESGIKYVCESCARVLCENCVQSYGSINEIVPNDHENRMEGVISIRCCQFCAGLNAQQKSSRKNCVKVHPSDSPRRSPEPGSPAFAAERLDGYSPHAITRRSAASFSSSPSMVSFHGSPNRSDEEEEENSTSQFFSASSEYYNDASDVETSSISVRHAFYSFQSVGSSPSGSPSRIHITSDRVGHPVQLGHQGTSRSPNDGPFVEEAMSIFKRPGVGTDMTNRDADSADDLTSFGDQNEKPLEPLDFENNGLIWFPPPPDVEEDDNENSFKYDDEDDDIGEPSTSFTCSDSFASEFQMKEKHNREQNKPLKNVVHGHFRVLVSQLLLGEGIKIDKNDSNEDWLDIITSISWQAANYVKPDTSKGGSMDPCDYVKIKCLASGSPSESTLIRGVVCTKNIKHKRMTSLYKNAKVLLLGGSLEYQRLSNQLASLDTLLQQESEHIKVIISKIEAHHPNVLLVEKTVSSRAQEYLLAKDISLVSNVKRSLLERIARCTGALITPSIDKLSATRVGHCELFHLERISEEHEFVNQVNKKPSKTLMYFEGCPRRLGCTVLLKGSCHEELKKVKHVVQYAVFAAYHLSLENSFLADEGASLPRVTLKSSVVLPDRVTADSSISFISASDVHGTCEEVTDVPNNEIISSCINSDSGLHKSLSECFTIASMSEECIPTLLASAADFKNLADNHKESPVSVNKGMKDNATHEVPAEDDIEEKQQGAACGLTVAESLVDVESSTAFCPTTDSHQSILVSFSSRCVLSGTVCERSRLLRIKYYGCFDKPLGRYLQDDLFAQTSCCRSCKEPTEVHVICYTHPHGNLTINVKRLPSFILPGERDGKIWMWHRCLRCIPSGGVPPATRRIVMSDAAWGLSFGKFLELSFSNHATANRIASCGHSLQRDCLRFYGYGNMVAFFRYSPVDIHSVCLAPSILEFNGLPEHDRIRKESMELSRKVELLYTKISSIIRCIEEKSSSYGSGICDSNELINHILGLHDLLIKERNEYNDLLWSATDGITEPDQEAVDILELNRVRHSLLIDSHVWDRRLYLLESLFESCASSKVSDDASSSVGMQECSSDARLQYESLERGHEEILLEASKLHGCPGNDSQSEETNSLNNTPDMPKDSSTSYEFNVKDGTHVIGENMLRVTSLECAASAASVLSDKIDSAWTGAEQPPEKAQLPHSLLGERSEASRPLNQTAKPIVRKFISPARVYSFDSAVRFQERLKKGLPPSTLHLSTLRSFHAYGDYKSMVRDPVSYMQRTHSQISTAEAQQINPSSSNFASFISSISIAPEGARLMVPHNRRNNIVIAVYDNEPTSIISYVIASKEHEDWIADKPNTPVRGYKGSPVASNISGWQSFGSLDIDYMQYGSYGSEDASNTIGFSTEPKSSPHLKVSFEDESSGADGRVKFVVTCYFARQFDALRKRCCPNEVDFLCSLSRCRRWSAQGGKSNVYFAKSIDERFIVKQVTRTELESFEEFAPGYFKYLTDSLSSGSPTCLAKILGIYQVTVKNMKGGKETKMDLMVMENLFYGKNISRVYDLKGSVRSRYNSDTSGRNKVLLDMNLVETLRTKPIFLGSKAKRRLERAVWNDTSFLASVDVMDYSLLVGVDEELKELVVGIIDFMRQYTWDKHLETWVKASGILGGPKNASPTIISPKQYKKRFRKAMTTYFLTVPDQWSS